MKPILSFVGSSNSGKTTLIKNVLGILLKDGLKIAVVKHSQSFELDIEGKDSWQFYHAGSNPVVMSSPHQLAIFKKNEHDLTPQEIAHFINSDVDLILAEGFKKSNSLKIEVLSSKQVGEPSIPSKQLLAVITDVPLNTDIPQFSRDDYRGLASLIKKWLKTQTKDEVNLLVNDSFIPLNGFTRDILSKTLLGMLSTLKGCEDIKTVNISLRRTAKTNKTADSY